VDLSFVEPKTVFLIAHLIGLAFGVGGALISDLLFMKSMRDGRIDTTEMNFLVLGSNCVTFGLLLMIASGIGLFSLNPEAYLVSQKFLAKMTVVGVLTVNGILFHLLHIPTLVIWSKGMLSPEEFGRRRFGFLASGVVSIVSWCTALTLGAFKILPLSYGMILGVYASALVIGIFIGVLLIDRLIPYAKKAS